MRISLSCSRIASSMAGEVVMISMPSLTGVKHEGRNESGLLRSATMQSRQAPAGAIRLSWQRVGM